MKNKQKKSGLARLFQFAMNKKGLMISSIILSALSAVASFVPYFALYQIISNLIEMYPDFNSANMDVVMSNGFLALFGIIANIALYMLSLIASHLAAFGTLFELKLEFANHLSKLPLGLHLLIGSGKLRKIMDENIENIEGFIAHEVPDIVSAMVAPVLMIVLVLMIDWRYGLAVLVCIILAFFIQITYIFKKDAQARMNEHQEALERMNNGAVEYIRGIAVVKAFNQTVKSFTKFYNSIHEYTVNTCEYTMEAKNPMCGFNTVVNNLYLMLIPLGIIIGSTTKDYEVFASNFIFYIVFVPSISSILTKVMYSTINSMKIVKGVEYMDAILNEEKLKNTDNGKTVENYSVEFKDVTFSYNGENNALDGITFQAKSGEITALVGPSGGGKSTIGKLIPRFFDVTAGSILIDGIDVKDMKNEYLMEKVSFVFQDVYLFKQSIMDNILLGKKDTSREEVIKAAKAAQCHEFIMQLPKGYDSIIGENGIHLSGGERQRISIARAIIKDAPIVVLDEATAFSDPENEHLIQRAFHELMKNKTVIMIAHRLYTIKSADNIVVLDRGKLVEQGSHEELLSREGKYYNMWNAYTGTLSWKIKNREVINNA